MNRIPANLSLPAMKFSISRLAFILGAFILGLIAIDGLVQLNREAYAGFGMGTSQWVAADSAMALFLVGLVAGIVLGIAVFFAYIVWREKNLTEEPDDLDALLDEIASEEAEDEENPLFVEDSTSEEPIESLDPWERPADWWKGEEN